MSDLPDQTLHLAAVTGPAGYAAGVDYPDWTITDDTVTGGGGGFATPGYGAKVNNGSTITLAADGTPYFLTGWGVTIPGGWATAGFVNTSRWSLDIQADGLYDVGAHCQLNQGSTPSPAGLGITIYANQGTAANIFEDSFGPAAKCTAGIWYFAFSAPMKLLAGNYLTIIAERANASTGGTDTAQLSHFWAVKLSGIL